MKFLIFRFKRLILSLIITTCHITAFAQKVDVDLSGLVVDKTIKGYNRQVTIIPSGPKGSYIHLNENEGAGMAWLEGVQFSDGTIEFDVKGRNVLQQSFVGIAFHGSNDSTYDAVYLRPFNFKSQEEERRNHSVQYISLPKYDWPKLRSEFPNKYEQPISPAPEPEDWVHCRLVIKNDEIKIFINDNSTPSLTVKTLGNHKGTKIGFWVGNGSDGDFANLDIRKNV
ncbi:hypothetical protein [Dyadobacter psychrotolerans]|uniref:DUF1080 domain-containing protein n=1 Tax=Dyadobacter psychrotolerans TaxID=2541721 RepID=A0A4R5DVH5_9BACT|nr:hypothetical protein [Dyadobacter psychrotolerans]TDE18556.1 hypothetical protein E0F88_03190 [Dyadobacter psychrotolerans]